MKVLMVNERSMPVLAFNLVAVQMHLLQILLGCGTRQRRCQTLMLSKTMKMRKTNIHPRA
jgi:hypothetical protein